LFISVKNATVTGYSRFKSEIPLFFSIREQRKEEKNQNRGNSRPSLFSSSLALWFWKPTPEMKTIAEEL